MEEAVEKYIEQKGIKFELRAVDEDGEVIMVESSDQSFDDVAGFSGLLDERFMQLVAGNANDVSDESDGARDY